jgi:hypothetical protein
MDPGSHLSDEDRSGADNLAAEYLDASALALAIAAVARAALSLFVRHFSSAL